MVVAEARQSVDMIRFKVSYRSNEPTFRITNDIVGALDLFASFICVETIQLNPSPHAGSVHQVGDGGKSITRTKSEHK